MLIRDLPFLIYSYVSLPHLSSPWGTFINYGVRVANSSVRCVKLSWPHPKLDVNSYDSPQERTKHFAPSPELTYAHIHEYTHTYSYALRFMCISYYFIYLSSSTALLNIIMPKDKLSKKQNCMYLRKKCHIAANCFKDQQVAQRDVWTIFDPSPRGPNMLVPPQVGYKYCWPTPNYCWPTPCLLPPSHNYLMVPWHL